MVVDFPVSGKQVEARAEGRVLWARGGKAEVQPVKLSPIRDEECLWLKPARSIQSWTIRYDQRSCPFGFAQGRL